MGQPQTTLPQKAALLLGSLGLALVLIEGLCRVLLMVELGSPEQVFRQIGVGREPLLGFELLPDRRAVPLPAVKTTYSTNSLGFRDAREFAAKASHEIRIVVMGGSSVFGYGATGEETTIAGVLERDLAARFPDRLVTVINAGTPGFNSFQVLAKLQLKVLDLEPDFLVLYLGWNDLIFSASKEPRRKNSIMGEDRYSAMDSWQRFITAINREVPWVPARPLALTVFVDRALRKPPPPGTLFPPAVVHLAEGQLYDNLSSIVAVARYRGVDSLLVTLVSETDYLSTQRAALNEAIRRVARESGSTLIDADARVRAERPAGISDEQDHYHLTDRGNRYLAELLAAELSRAISSPEG